MTVRSEKTRGSAAERARGVLVGLIGAGGVAGGVIGYLDGKPERIVELTLIYRAPRV